MCCSLTLGRLLEVKNIDYTIFERDATPQLDNSRTGTLDLHAGDGQLALEEAGLTDAFKKLARWDTPTVLASARGETIITLNEAGESDRPEIDRKDLRNLLLGSIPAEKIRWDSKVQRVLRDDQGSISIHFVNGMVEKGFKLVVGADGAWSKTRSLITSVKPRYTGLHYFASTIKQRNPHYQQTSSLVGGGTYMALGGGKQIVAQRLGDGSYFVGIGLHLAEIGDVKEELADTAAFRERLVDRDFVEYAEK